MKNLIEKQVSNNLIYKTSKVFEGMNILVAIKLNDECKNGHQDFAITADIYQANKPLIEKNRIMGGCCHDEIIKVFPQFKIFVDLHLCDYTGTPMYAVENGFYHLTNGFNNTKIENPNFKGEYCNYYRLTPEQYDILTTSKNKIQFAINIQKLGILKQWKKQADAAIKILETLTEKTFLVDSVKTQFNAPTKEQLKEEAEKVKSGYYTEEAEEKRKAEKLQSLFDKLIIAKDIEFSKINLEYEVKKQVLTIGGEIALKNCIFYNHAQTLTFNWRSYDMISSELFEKIKETIKLPEGVKIENAEGKSKY